MNRSTVIDKRMERQGLSHPAGSEQAYEAIFRAQQPVPTIYFAEPGVPPQLRDRCTFDDGELNFDLREDRTIVKARFNGGNVGYVYADDLELYATVYRKALPYLSEEQQLVYDCILRAGPLYREQMVEETGLKSSVITKALGKLQRAFLVHVEQGDAYDIQLWYDFMSEWSEVDLERRDRSVAIITILKRFISNMVFATTQQIKDWSRLTVKEVKAAIQTMVEAGDIVEVNLEGEQGYMLREDHDELEGQSLTPPQSVHIVHRADYLARAHESELKKRYKGYEVLQYIMVNGEFCGIVQGHWRIGPHDVDDIVIELPDKEKAQLKGEIIAEVSRFYNPPYSHILRYDGKDI